MLEPDLPSKDAAALVQHIASLSQEIDGLIENRRWQELVLLDGELSSLIHRVFEGLPDQRLQTDQLNSLQASLTRLLSGIERAKLERGRVTEQFSKSKQARSAVAAYSICKN